MNVPLIDRFFAATILGGCLHVDGIPEWGPWEASRLHWGPGDHVDLILPTTGDWKVGTLRRTRSRDQGADEGGPNEKRVDSREPGG